jgi:hypothetical protein
LLELVKMLKLPAARSLEANWWCIERDKCGRYELSQPLFR